MCRLFEFSVCLGLNFEKIEKPTVLRCGLWLCMELSFYSRVPFGRNPKQPNSGGLLPRCGFSQCLLFTL